jgi:alpha-tubulin suppressor-like RCC1 family protein
MRWTGSIVTVVLGVMAVLLPLQSVDAGVRAPFTEAGRRPLGPRVSSGGNTQFGIATCVVNADGTVRCWGNRAAITRQFPSGLNAAPFIPFTAPVSIEGVAGAVTVAVGDGHACALRHDGRVLCWGENGSGQLGLGSVTTQQSFAPTLVSSLSGVVGIAAGGSVTCAVLVDGTARCWGLNNAGQLGTLAASGPVPSPVQVLSQPGVALSGLVGITTDGGHTCAQAASSSVFCWGSNSSGEVDGTPTVDPQLAPRFVGDAVDVAAGRLYTCAVSANGTARCWGINSGGELGTGNTNRTSGQPQVVGLTGAVAIAGSFGHTCALLVNGSAACWGARASG